MTLTSDGSGGSPTPEDFCRPPLPDGTVICWPPSGPVTLYAYADSFDNNDPNNILYVEIPEADEYNNQSNSVLHTFAAPIQGNETISSQSGPRPDLSR